MQGSPSEPCFSIGHIPKAVVPFMLVYLLFIIGLIALLLGGDWLVKGAVGLAKMFGISPLIIGLTIVALGTSAPELLISLRAALTGSSGLAVGNVVGSNIANVLLVLGFPALIATMCCADDDIKSTLFFLVGLTGAFMVQMAFGPINRLDGLLLVLCLIAFLTQQFLAARRQNRTREAEEEHDFREEVGPVPTSIWVIVGFLMAGLVALPIGASLTVDSAVEIATRWEVPEEVIGLTIVAIGTSLPELATGVMAARQNNASVAIGNVIGSNLFNIAAIMGITATVAGTINVPAHIIDFDMWVMLAATMFLIAIPAFNLSINRLVGSLLLIAYAVYLVTTAIL